MATTIKSVLKILFHPEDATEYLEGYNVSIYSGGETRKKLQNSIFGRES